MKKNNIKFYLSILNINSINQLDENDLDYWHQKKFIEIQRSSREKELVSKQLIELNIAKDYLDEISLETLKKHILKAPIKTYLKKGEVVSWGSHVPHESLKGLKEKYISRYSVAAHYVPLHSKFETSLGRNSTDFAERFESEEFYFKN